MRHRLIWIFTDAINKLMKRESLPFRATINAVVLDSVTGTETPVRIECFTVKGGEAEIIRAIGNIAKPDMLAGFAEYLEVEIPGVKP